MAGRVFGAREFSFDEHGLQVRSDGTPFEIGLPLARPVDLQRFPILHIAASATATTNVRVALRATLDAPEADSPPTALRGDDVTIDLGAQPGSPDRAAMLRLRFELPAKNVLHLYSASLELRAGSPPALLRELPRGSVEQQMLALREIHEHSPAAIVVVDGDTTTAIARSHTGMLDTFEPSNPNWIVVGLFVLLVVLARLRPPRVARMRALLEIVVVLAVPIWLVVGGHFTGRVDPAQACLIAAATAYAITLAWPRIWKWNGSPRAWIAALAVIALAFFIGFAFHRAEVGWRSIGSGHFVRYLGWALIQQYLICAVCLERWRVATGSGWLAVYLSALCFALLHTPNSTLMLATFAGGLCWCALYLRERALLPLAFSHAASAMTLIALLPPEVLLSAEVSARFFQ